MTSLTRLEAQLLALIGGPLSIKYSDRILPLFIDLHGEFEKGNSPMSAKTKKEIIISEVQNAIIEEFGFTFQDLMKASRVADLVWARQFALCLLRENGMRLNDASKIFNKNHATTLHAIRKIHDLSDVDKKTREQYQRLQNRTTNGIEARLNDFQTKMESARGTEPDSDIQNQVEVTTKKEHWHTIPKHDYSSAS